MLEKDTLQSRFRTICFMYTVARDVLWIRNFGGNQNSCPVDALPNVDADAIDAESSVRMIGMD
jgi:hypothetical protein